MFRIRITTDIARVQRRVDDMARRQIPAAAVAAVNRTVEAVRHDLVEGIKRSFDRPTPWTLNSVFVGLARFPGDRAVVFLKDKYGKGVGAGRYLRPQIDGGPRTDKSSERRLHNSGVLPAGRFLVPAKGAELDAYGNMKGAQMVKIVSALNSFNDAGYSANAWGRKGRGKRKGQDYFAVQPGHRGALPPGVYRRTPQGGHIMVFVFGKQPTYRPRFDFRGIGAKSVRRHLTHEMGKSMRKALNSTA